MKDRARWSALARRPSALLILVVLVATSCSGSGGSSGERAGGVEQLGVQVPPLPELDAQVVSIGEELYGQYCASCHGVDLSGTEDWKTRNPDGSYPPPPQDSSGHTWHHGDQLLVDLIRDGFDVPESRMPSFGDRLTDVQIAAILEYFKSNWGPDERAFQWEITSLESAGQ